MSNRITHSGVVERVEGDYVKVRIVQTSACAACKVANHCNAAESKVKIVDVLTSDSSAYRAGEEVVVSASKDVANRALLLGFGLPFLLLVGMLVVMLRLTSEQGLAALGAIGALIPYYILLWLMRDRIRQQISFRIEK